MPLGLSVALALAAQAATAPPANGASPEAPTAAPADKAANSADACRSARPGPDTREIVICAERPQGYRIDPDILAVGKMKRPGGRPTRPGPGGMRDTSACAVGPQGCQSAGINLIGAALTAAEMAARLAKGQEIGSMFVTDPSPSDYQLYLMAKRAREAAEAEKAGKLAKAKAAQAKAAQAK